MTILTIGPQLGALGIMRVLEHIAETQGQSSARRPEPVQILPEHRFTPYWMEHYPVEKLRPGDVICHPNAGWRRRVTIVKAHPKGGVQIKSVPEWRYKKTCANPDGKTLKHHITGTVRRWDGTTMVER